MLDTDFEPVDYPTSDGRPMGETDVHRNLLFDILHGLKWFFRERQDVYVSGNLLLFYEEGNRRRHLSPDVLVVLGVAGHDRDNYLLWKEGKAPDLIFEFTSKSTRWEDLGDKKGLYACMGVREYVIFDPLEEYLEPRLRLYRLAGEDYLPVAGRPLRLETVPLELQVQDRYLRLYDPATRALLPTIVETATELVEKRVALAEKEAALAEKEAALAEKDAALSEKDAALSEKDAALSEKDARIAELERRLAETEGGPG